MNIIQGFSEFPGGGGGGGAAGGRSRLFAAARAVDTGRRGGGRASPLRQAGGGRTPRITRTPGGRYRVAGQRGTYASNAAAIRAARPNRAVPRGGTVRARGGGAFRR